MTTLVDRVVREPSIQSAARYARRVRLLAAAYVGLFFGSAIGIGLIVWKAQFFVTLSQRSNVETLTLAFFLVFFSYLVLLSMPGLWGALRIMWFDLRGARGTHYVENEQAKVRALGPPQGAPAVAAMNMQVDLASRPAEPFRIPIADPAGSMGEIVIDGVRIAHRPVTRDGSNALLAYFVEQVNRVAGTRHHNAELDIVEWHKINDENTEKYLSIAHFARNLQRHLGIQELWPQLTLSEHDCAELERHLSGVCAALRNEAFLPEWEYEGTHQIPLIPQPLGLVQLNRDEKRVDPLASMGCAVFVVLAVVIVLALFILFPPWVPGA